MRKFTIIKMSTMLLIMAMISVTVMRAQIVNHPDGEPLTVENEITDSSLEITNNLNTPNMVKEGAEYCTLLENYNGFLIHRTETITFEGERIDRIYERGRERESVFQRIIFG